MYVQLIYLSHIQKELLCVADGNYYRNIQLAQMRRTTGHGAPNASWYFQYISENIIEERVEDCKSQKTRRSASRHWLLYVTSICTHEILQVWLHKDLQNDTIPTWIVESHKAPSLDEELQAINGCRGRKNQSSSVTSLLRGYPVPRYQPWSETYQKTPTIPTRLYTCNDI